MENLQNILDQFDTIGLKEAEGASLMNRMQVKYVFNVKMLTDILSRLTHDYSLVIIGSSGLNIYKNQYFDTTGHEMYLKHHNGRMNRHKVRFRTYVNTGVTFFEIKFKTNKGRTIKNRIVMPNQNLAIHGKAGDILAPTGYTADELHHSLNVNFTRITLVSKTGLERITFDVKLNYSWAEQTTEFPRLVIAEVKQPKSTASTFTTLMHEFKIRSLPFSKYCLGIATIKPFLKINNFKSTINYVNKLCKD